MDLSFNREKGLVIFSPIVKRPTSNFNFSESTYFIVFRQSIRESITVIPIVSDIDIYINGGLELEEVEVEINAIDQEFVPTSQGTFLLLSYGL